MKGVVSLLQAVGIWLLILLVTVGVGSVALAVWAAPGVPGRRGRARGRPRPPSTRP